MLFRESGGSYIAYILYSLCLIATILFQLDRGFILPIIDYCDTVWAPPTTLLSKSMEYIHARFVSHMSNDVGFVKVTLTEHHRFHTIVQVYKILH